MQRRDFIRAMLTMSATTALPSKIWPFRKIFLPPAPAVVPVWEALERCRDDIPELFKTATGLREYRMALAGLRYEHPLDFVAYMHPLQYQAYRKLMRELDLAV